MIVDIGEKIHVSLRRNFDADMRRHFVGEVIHAEGSLVRAAGYFFIFDPLATAFVKKPELRTSIFSLGGNEVIVNILPFDVQIEDLHYAKDGKNLLMLMDYAGYSLDINEFGSNR